MIDRVKGLSLIKSTEFGLYCELGQFYIDPQRPVRKALITHGHSDHARPYMGSYLTSNAGKKIIQERVGKKSKVQGLLYGKKIKINDVIVSFHPAGHILGSSQIRIEHKGYVCVVTGDYKTLSDNSCEKFELIKCNEILSEATFASPFYRWPDPKKVFSEINKWWHNNTIKGITSIIFSYALGKSQRVLCGLDPLIGPIGVHSTVDKFNVYYRSEGIHLPKTIKADRNTKSVFTGNGIIIAPPSTRNSNWIKQFKKLSLSFASGWMFSDNARKRKGLDAGFALSDHADWNEIINVIRSSGATKVGLHHGRTKILSDWIVRNLQLEVVELKSNFFYRKNIDRKQMSFIDKLI